jgi:hypothetical protein
MPTITRPPRLAAGRVVSAAALLVALTALAATACSGPGDASGKAAPSTGPVDACAQLLPSDIAGVLGPNSPPQPSAEGSGDSGVTSCTWENPDTSQSITLEIRSAGTAPGGKLPDPDPAQSAQPVPNADDMLLVGGDQVEFAAGDRLCFLQVLTDEAQKDKDRDTAVRLAQGVRDRL